MLPDRKIVLVCIGGALPETLVNLLNRACSDQLFSDGDSVLRRVVAGRVGFFHSTLAGNVFVTMARAKKFLSPSLTCRPVARSLTRLGS
jgi:hypothetical protein